MNFMIAPADWSLSTRIFVGLLLTSLAYLLMVDPAFAQSASGGGFRCDGATAVGTLYDSSMACDTTLSMSNVFSFLVCNMEQLAGNLLGQMYCGVITDLIPAVMGILTLATLFFGIGFTIGVIPATAKDFQLFLLKMAVIYIFATQSDYLIGTGYNLLITGLREGAAIGLSAMFENSDAAAQEVTGAQIYGYLDKFLAQAMHLATDSVGMKWDDPEHNPCKNALFSALALMVVAFPPIFFIAIMLIFRIAITFLRAVFGYLYSIIGIIFLLTLSPFFLSFYLFRQTRPFFDKWLGYLTSFALQMVIVFSFLGFILSINVSHITGSLTNIVVPSKEVLEGASVRVPWKYCTLCDFQVVERGTDKVIPDTQYDDFLTKGELVCKKGADGKPYPIGPLEAVSPGQSNDPKKQQAIQNTLLKFAATGLLSLFVLAYIVEAALSAAPMMAQILAAGMGASYAPQLGGGAKIGQKISLDVPGGNLYETFEQGFTDGYQRYQSTTAIGATTAGLVKGMERMVLGGDKGQGNDYGDGRNDAGMVETFANFILNPHNDTFGRR